MGPKCLKEQDSPNPRSSALTLLKSLAKKRLAVLNVSNNFGHTSRRTISRTPKTNNSSTPTRKWQRFLEPTAFVPLVWPSSFPLTCLQLRKVLSILCVPPHSWTEATSTGPPELGVLGVQYRLAPPIFHTFRRP